MRTLVIVCLVSLAVGIYKHQKGISDWHINTFGPLQNVHFSSSNLFYQTSALSSSGILSREGNVLYSTPKQPFKPEKSIVQDLLYFVNPEQLQIEVFSVDL